MKLIQKQIVCFNPNDQAWKFNQLCNSHEEKARHPSLQECHMYLELNKE